MERKHINNLVNLAAIVATLGPEQFDIGKVNECNSVGCCLGWASCHPHFNRQGLDFVENENSAYSSIIWKGTTISCGVGWLWSGHDVVREAVDTLFGINDSNDPLYKAFIHGKKYWKNYVFDSPETAAKSILRYVYELTGEEYELL